MKSATTFSRQNSSSTITLFTSTCRTYIESQPKELVNSIFKDYNKTVPVLSYILTNNVMSKTYQCYQDCHNILHASHQCLLGKVLTVADASFSDREQRKAAKDLIKSEFNDIWNNEMRDIVLSSFKCVSNIYNDPMSPEQSVGVLTL